MQSSESTTELQGGHCQPCMIYAICFTEDWCIAYKGSVLLKKKNIVLSYIALASVTIIFGSTLQGNMILFMYCKTEAMTLTVE